MQHRNASAVPKFFQNFSTTQPIDKFVTLILKGTRSSMFQFNKTNFYGPHIARPGTQSPPLAIEKAYFYLISSIVLELGQMLCRHKYYLHKSIAEGKSFFTEK